MKRTVRRMVQVLFLVLFALLVSTGKVRLWMGIFLVSVAASFLFGRIYCGWICPINTVLGPITSIKRALHIKSIPIPRFLAKGWVRISVLLLFFATFVLTMATGRNLPVLPVLFGLGVGLTLLFPEEFWHRYLCPYGTILSLTSKKSRYGLHIDPEQCNNCNACSNVCPALAIEKLEKHQIVQSDCLVCMRCQQVCRQKAIRYDHQD